MQHRNVLTLPFVLALLAGLSDGASEENPLRLIRHERAAVAIEDAIELEATPNLVKDSGLVSISWKNVPNPTADDWIGLWTLWETTSIDPKKYAPVKYQLCSMAESHLKTGSGQFKFYLANMRSPFQFGLLRGGLDKPVLAAQSGNVKFENYDVPLHGHLSLTRNHTQMVVMFVTLNDHKPQVKWGKVSGQLNNVQNAVSTTYEAKDMCDSPAKDYGFMNPNMINKVVIEGLSPGTKYYYQYGSADGPGGFSEEHMFVAPPIPGSNVTTKILAFGDLGHGQMDNSSEVIHTEPPSLNTTKRLIADAGDYDFVMHIGDISYAEGFASTWEEFFDQVGPLMVRLPYMVNTGNHESDSINSQAYYTGHDSGGECNVPYTKRFAMPRESDAQPWYGFDYGSVHIIMMSTEHDFRNTSKQWSDLVKYFEEVDRKRTPWLIFSGHRPMYVDSTSIAGSRSDQSTAGLLRGHVEPLLSKYKVDLALWGHHHSYQRTCAVYDEKCVDDGTVHVVIGMAGQGLSQNLRKDKPSYFEFVDDQHYGYTRLVANATALTMDFIRNIDGAKGDSFTITKDQKCFERNT